MDDRHTRRVHLRPTHGKVYGLAVHGEVGTGVGLVDAGQDLDQGGLARAVLAGEAVDLAWGHDEVDVGKYLR